MSDDTPIPPAAVEAVKPCPWCGKEPIVSPSGDWTGVMIDCCNPTCAVQPHVSYYSDGMAVRVWNRRAPDASAARLEAALDLLRDLAWSHNLSDGVGPRCSFCGTPQSIQPPQMHGCKLAAFLAETKP